MKQHLRIPKNAAIQIKKAVLANREKIYREILETRELYDLMLKWSSGQKLSLSEKKAVKTQLLDICKTIPALAVFMVPFGSILLLVLIRYLPFNILPSSFQADPEDLGPT